MISFAIPWALLGLVAAGVPLLLHLVQRRDAPEVLFPAVQYLADATREQNRRFKFRHWLLLLVRTLLIVALVLAAAGASVRRTSIGPHAPSALVLVVDNSAASGVVVDGEPALRALRQAAIRVLDRASSADRLWLITADGVPRAGTPADLRRDVAALQTQPVRLDLGRAVTAGSELVRTAGRPGEVVLASAMQRSALSAARGDVPVLVIRPQGDVATNRAIADLAAGAQPWNPSGGRVTITISSSDTAPVPVTLAVGGRILRDVLVTPGVPSMQRIGPQPPGWTTITASLPPDEFRLDDSRTIAVRIAPPVAAQWDSSDHFLSTAMQVLVADGRARAGVGVRFGAPGPGISVVMPPEDPARVGALNRLLAARGVPWQYGALIDAPVALDSGGAIGAHELVRRHYLLESTGASAEVLATASGSPWLVRGGTMLLIGSRLEPAWTTLPLSASFVPFVDAMLTSAAPGAAIASSAVAGEIQSLPARVAAIAHDGTIMATGGGGRWTPPSPGVFHLLAGTDTLGAVSVRLDERVSHVSRASDREIGALWPGAIMAGLNDGPGLAFTTGSRGDLRGALLLLALCCALAETLLAGRVRKRN